MKFKQWLEIAMSSDGMKDVEPTQTSQATAQVAQNWLGDKDTATQQSDIVLGANNRSKLGAKLLDAGASAITMAPRNIAVQTTAPAVAGFLQNQFKLPQVISPPKPTQMKLMRKKMEKK